MLITEKINADYISIRCNYYDEYIQKFRKIPGAYFDRISKKWIIPIKSFDSFEKNFKGEIIYKTPRWIILQAPLPNNIDMYKISNEINIPKLKLETYKYQNFGIKFMIDRLKNNNFVINADDVGLGKTIMTIAVLQYFFKKKIIKRILISCKKSIKNQWAKEIDKFSTMLENTKLFFLEGTPKKRSKDIDKISKNDTCILITNYQIVMKDINSLKKLNFDMLVIDEVHNVKAREGVMNNALKLISKTAKYTVFLTGTPIMSKPDDIYGIINIADDNYFGPWSKFSKEFIISDFNYGYYRTVGYKNLDKLRELVQDILIRRTEHEVSIDLPKILPSKIIDCDMDKVQEKLYEILLSKKSNIEQLMINDKKLLKDKNYKTEEIKENLKKSIEIKENLLLSFTNFLQIVSNDPRILLKSRSKLITEDIIKLIPKKYSTSPKTSALLELIEEIITSDNKVLIFTRFERAAYIIQKNIKTSLKLNSLTYTGCMNDLERNKNIDLFKNSFEYNILIGTDAMSEGLNLQEAAHVINYDQPFTPAIKTQRIGRCRRVSSFYKKIHVYDLITENSEDIKRLEELEKSTILFNGIIELNKSQSEFLKQQND